MSRWSKGGKNDVSLSLRAAPDLIRGLLWLRAATAL